MRYSPHLVRRAALATFGLLVVLSIPLEVQAQPLRSGLLTSSGAGQSSLDEQVLRRSRTNAITGFVLGGCTLLPGMAVAASELARPDDEQDELRLKAGYGVTVIGAALVVYAIAQLVVAVSTKRRLRRSRGLAGWRIPLSG